MREMSLLYYDSLVERAPARLNSYYARDAYHGLSVAPIVAMQPCELQANADARSMPLDTGRPGGTEDRAGLTAAQEGRSDLHMADVA
jgi:hypothetical protein